MVGSRGVATWTAGGSVAPGGGTSGAPAGGGASDRLTGAPQTPQKRASSGSC